MNREEIIKLIKENLTIEINEHDSYQYGGGYKKEISVKLFFDGEEISESCSFSVTEAE